MASFTTLSADDVGLILREFAGPDGGDDAAVADYRGHHPIAAGTINTNLRVDTGAGPRFLRINEGKTEDDVAREAAIVLHVAQRGVPTPPPALAADGRPFTRWSGRLASLFPWLPGRTISRAEVRPAHARRAGAALAGLHLASEGFPDHRPGRYEPDEIDRRLAAVAGAAAAGRPELAAAVATLGPELAALRVARQAAVPAGIIHGDLFIDNVLFTEEDEEEDEEDDEDDGDAGALVALLDFEQASWGRFSYDLAVTLLAFAFGRDDFRADVTRALLDGYARVRPPSADERAVFGAELRFASCRFAVTRITDVHLKRGQGAPPGKEFGRYLARLAQVRRHLAAADGLLDLPLP